MSSTAELIELGRQLGYQDESLQAFVNQEKIELREKERVALEREDRALERQARKEEVERQARKEEAERQAKREEAERLERDKDREVQIELAKIAAEAEKVKASQIKTEHNPFKEMISKIPKLAPFSHKDEMDAYIFRFEMLTKSYKWSDESKFFALSNLLTGDSLKVLHSLAEGQQSYQQLKDALLKRYSCTEDGYCTKFRNVVPLPTEDVDTFISRTEMLFDRWVDKSGIEKDSFVMLRDLIVRDQLLRSLNNELVVFLKERTPKSLKEVRQEAEKLVSAYPNKSLARQETALANIGVKSNYPDKRDFKHFDNESQRRDKQDQPRGRFREKRSQSCGYSSFENGEHRFPSNDHTYRYRDNQNDRDFKRGFPRGRSSYNQRGYNRRPYRGNERYQFNRPGTSHIVASATKQDNSSLKFFSAKVNNTPCRALRDTGCTFVAIRDTFIGPNDYTGDMQTFKMFDGSHARLPTAYAHIDTPFYTGNVVAIILPNPVCDLVIGNIDGVDDSHLNDFSERRDHADNDEHPTYHACVSTRASCKADNPLSSANDLSTANVSCKNKNNEIKDTESSHTKKTTTSEPIIDIGHIFDVDNFVIAQANDPSLNEIREKALLNDTYFFKDNIIYRRAQKDFCKDQLVVPLDFREKVLLCCHDAPAAGHMGVAATKKRICDTFTWPGIMNDIKNYVKSCDICQRHAPKLPRLPIQQANIINKPFDKVCIDIAGPLNITAKKNRYILTLVDVGTRWPEAVALREIKTTDIANALFSVFSRLGIPREVLSDNGQQLISNAMNETMSMLGISRSLSTAYHSQSNGLVERMNGSLKNMLYKLTSDKPNSWDEKLDAVLFAYREIPNTSTGYPPFTLMFGREVRGPADVLAGIFAGSNEKSVEYVFVHQYAQQVHEDIKEACQAAAINAEKELERHRRSKNTHTRFREFAKGDKVLILLPKDGNTMIMKYQGPYTIESVSNNNNYFCRVGSSLKRYHANIIKSYTERVPSPPHDIITPFAGVAFIDELNCDDSESKLEFLSVKQKEFPDNAYISEDLSSDKQEEARRLLRQFPKTLSDIPGKTSLLQHSIRLTDETPFRIRQYPIPVHAKKEVEDEIENMRKCGIIRPSSSPYSSPLCVVRKRDNTIRLCMDFRKLNSITVFDAEPIPTLGDLLSQLKGAIYFTKFDLTKGYWQIPLAENSKAYTAFQTSQGLFEFNFLPFGLSTASCSFQKCMRKALGSLPFIISYFDDVLIFSKTWEEHIKHIRQTLETLEEANFTIKPSKTSVGCTSIDFLGHVVSAGCIRPDKAKTQKILEIKVPQTKKQVRQVLGLLGYYRSFVKDFSTIAQPLSDITRKSSANKINWSNECQQSLDTLKKTLTTEPVLQVPDLSKPFVVQCDASNKGIGAVLSQNHDGILLPCSFASRRLLPREENYAIIEKECLAIVFALNNFAKYLLIKPFFIQTDHAPLSFLKQKKTKNSRLMRWSLSIQQYSFTVQHIRGFQNVVSDALSRAF